MGLIFVVVAIIVTVVISKTIVPTFVEYFPYIFAVVIGASLCVIMKIYGKLNSMVSAVVVAATALITIFLTAITNESLFDLGLAQTHSTGAPVPSFLSNSMDLLSSNATKTFSGIILASILVVTVFYKDQARDPEVALAWRQKMRPKFESYRNKAIVIIFFVVAFLLFNRLVDGN